MNKDDFWAYSYFFILFFWIFSYFSVNSLHNFKKIVNNRKRKKYDLKYAVRNLGALGNTLKSPIFVHQWSNLKGEVEHTRCQTSQLTSFCPISHLFKGNANDLYSKFPSLCHTDLQQLRNPIVSISSLSPICGLSVCMKQSQGMSMLQLTQPGPWQEMISQRRRWTRRPQGSHSPSSLNYE